MGPQETEPSSLFKIAHISDLHIAKPNLNPLQFFSKRWIGNLNSVVNRRNHFDIRTLYDSLELFKKENITHVIITGDFTTTGSKEELIEAKKIIEAIKEEGLQVIFIPGNHDIYTKASHKRKTFFKHLEDMFPSEEVFQTLRDDKVTKLSLGNNWWVVAIDTCMPAPFYRSTGLFTEQHKKNLSHTLETIPKDDFVILLNHFPLFQVDKESRSMLGASMLKEVVQNHPNIQLFLHGHTHRNAIADLRKNSFPILSDSGSFCYTKKGSWNLIEIFDTHCQVDAFSLNKDKSQTELWNKRVSHNFLLEQKVQCCER